MYISKIYKTHTNSVCYFACGVDNTLDIRLNDTTLKVVLQRGTILMCVFTKCDYINAPLHPNTWHTLVHHESPRRFFVFIKIILPTPSFSLFIHLYQKTFEASIY